MIYKVGLTGLIGSGKSLAASLFAEFGTSIIDTDLIAHDLTQPGGMALTAIFGEFGEKYICNDGSLNRSEMRKLIFKDPDARLNLESILHPLIFDKVVQDVGQAHGLYVIIVVPLLFKSGSYLELINRSIFVDCAEDTLIKRVMMRSALTIGEVREILNSQLSREIQLKMADDILDNNNDKVTLRSQIGELNEKYKILARS